MENYITSLKKEFYYNTEFNNCINCILEIKHPKYKELVIGFIFGGGKKQMLIYNKITKIQISY